METKKNEREAPEMRYERKFVAPEEFACRIENILKVHPFVFSEIYYRRNVNNIYLDSNMMKSYYDNVDGLSARRKVRVRWYGDMFGDVESPALEIKEKSGVVGRKQSWRIGPFGMSEKFSARELMGAMCSSSAPEAVKLELKCLKPVLFNSYSRRYFMSGDGRFRITVDDGMTARRLDTFGNSFLQEIKTDHIVVELKYDVEHDREATGVTAHLPFRIFRSSKYVTGMLNIYNPL